MDQTSEMIIKIFTAGASIVGLAGFVYGYFQNKKYKKERDMKAKALMESAHELAKAQNANKSIDQLIDDSNKRYGPAMADKSKGK